MKIVSSLKQAPLRLVVFGPDGVGKSTFAAGAPDPVFLCAENGIDFIDTRKVEGVTTWPELIEAVGLLANESSCKTIVIDSIDWCEQLVFDQVCKAANVDDIEKVGGGFGKGYTAAINEWRGMIRALETARDKGKNVVLIAHAKLESVKNPAGEDYSVWNLKLHSKSAQVIREWVDFVGFAEIDTAIKKSDPKNKFSLNKTFTSGQRTIRFNPSNGIASKTRGSFGALPDKLPLNWEAFNTAVESARPKSVDTLSKELDEALRLLGDDLVSENCRSYLDKEGRSANTLRIAIRTVAEYLNAGAKADVL